MARGSYPGARRAGGAEALAGRPAPAHLRAEVEVGADRGDVAALLHCEQGPSARADLYRPELLQPPGAMG